MARFTTGFTCNLQAAVLTSMTRFITGFTCSKQAAVRTSMTHALLHALLVIYRQVRASDARRLQVLLLYLLLYLPQ
jgi:hypothetical protein